MVRLFVTLVNTSATRAYLHKFDHRAIGYPSRNSAYLALNINTMTVWPRHRLFKHSPLIPTKLLDILLIIPTNEGRMAFLIAEGYIKPYTPSNIKREMVRTMTIPVGF